jgi:hypothetical protein
MKLAVWLSAAAVTVTLFAMVAMSLLCKILFFFLIGNKPLLLVTRYFTHLHWWFLLGALPMFAAAYRLTSAPIVTTDRVLVFVSTCTLVIIVLFTIAAVAFLCPLLSITFRMGT